jgi:hypothetical protein
MRPVLVRTGPLCPHAHSMLSFVSPFPLVKVFTDAFTVFPRVTAWLGHPGLTFGAAGFSLGFWVTCTYTLLQASQYVQYKNLEESHVQYLDCAVFSSVVK